MRLFWRLDYALWGVILLCMPRGCMVDGWVNTFNATFSKYRLLGMLTYNTLSFSARS